MSQNILIIEDEISIARLMELELSREGYKTKIATDGNDGLELALSNKYDLIILDLMLPSISGIEICRRVRKVSNIPIIMVTARDDIMDKVTGLDIGADDYITKPFAIEELLARVRTALRRVSINTNIFHDVIIFNRLSIDDKAHKVMIDNNIIELTKREYDLLLFLVKNIGIVMSREVLLEKVWGFDYYGDTNIVDVYIRYLRSKIDEVYNVNYIQTIRGVGYVFKEEKGMN